MKTLNSCIARYLLPVLMVGSVVPVDTADASPWGGRGGHQGSSSRIFVGPPPMPFGGRPFPHARPPGWRPPHFCPPPPYRGVAIGRSIPSHSRPVRISIPALIGLPFAIIGSVVRGCTPPPREIVESRSPETAYDVVSPEDRVASALPAAEDRATNLRQSSERLYSRRSGRADSTVASEPLGDTRFQTPADADSVSNRGVERFSEKDYRGALFCFDRAVEKTPSHQAAWAYRGATLVKLGKIEEGRQSLERAVQIEPTSAEASQAQKWLNKL